MQLSTIPNVPLLPFKLLEGYEEETTSTEKQPYIEYLKKYYPTESSKQKLQKLIQYYMINNKWNSRYLTAQARQIWQDYASIQSRDEDGNGNENGVKYKYRNGDREDQYNPQMSGLVDFDFNFGSQVLTKSILGEMWEEASYREFLHGLRVMSCGRKEQVKLNYILFRNKNKPSKPTHTQAGQIGLSENRTNKFRKWRKSISQVKQDITSSSPLFLKSK